MRKSGPSHKFQSSCGPGKETEESSKVSGSGTDSLCISSWRFYASFHSLKNTLTPRTSASNIDENNNEDDLYQINNPSSAKAAQKI